MVRSSGGNPEEHNREKGKVGGQEGESMHQAEDVLLTVTQSWKSHSIASSTFYFSSQFQNCHIQGKGKRLMGTCN